MQKPGIIIALLCLWGAAEALSGELPALLVQEGKNTVSIAILNQGASDARLKVEVDQTRLPSWLTVLPGTETIAAPKGQKSIEKLALTLQVKGAPADGQVQVPLTLKDSAGESWNYTLQVHLAQRPTENALYTNAPNPFNPTTSISFALKENSNASLTIYNSLGQKIRTLLDRPQSAGIHTVMWDSRDDGGRAVSSGVYLYQLKAGNFTQTRKMLLTQ